MTTSLPALSPSALPAEHRRILLETVAGHFALHTRTCRIRACRRLGACRSARPGSRDGEDPPPCIAGLSAADRGTIDKLLSVLADIYRRRLWPPPARDGGRKWLQDKSIAIMRAALPRMPDCAADFARWHARFTAPPPPPVDAGAVLRQIKAEMDLADLARENRAIEARMRK